MKREMLFVPLKFLKKVYKIHFMLIKRVKIENIKYMMDNQISSYDKHYKWIKFPY